MNEKEHFYWLDALRFMAAFMVLLSHTRNDYFVMYGDLPQVQHTIPAFVFYTFGRLGHEAVIVFFVLSGFLVGGRGLERIKSGTLNVKSYFVDRFSRIYPPLVISIIFYYITSLFVPTAEWSFSIALGNLLNLQGVVCKSLVPPFWSLSYEWWFYMLLASLGVIFRYGKSGIRMIGLGVLFICVGIFLTKGMRVHYLLIWLLGAVAYLIRPRQSNKLLCYASLLGFIVGVGLYQLSKDSESMRILYKIDNRALIELLMAFMMCLFIQQIILIEPRSSFAKYVEKLLGKMGKFSYTLYLSHRIVMIWIFYFLYKKCAGEMVFCDVMGWISVVFICMGGCWMLYLLGERYTLQIRRKLKTLFLT